MMLDGCFVIDTAVMVSIPVVFDGAIFDGGDVFDVPMEVVVHDVTAMSDVMLASICVSVCVCVSYSCIVLSRMYLPDLCAVVCVVYFACVA